MDDSNATRPKPELSEAKTMHKRDWCRSPARRQSGGSLSGAVHKCVAALPRCGEGRERAIGGQARSARRRLWNCGGTPAPIGSTSRSAPSCSGTPCASAATTGSSTRRPASRRCCDFEWEMIADARTFERPANYALRAHHPAGWRQDRPGPPALRHHRSARRPRAGHRRVQAGLAGRRGAQGRAPGLLRDLLSRARARADPRGRLARRGRVPPHRRRAPSEDPQAGRDRQLPGRLGLHARRRRRAGSRRAHRDQRGADVLLGRQRRREPDALRGRHRSAAPGPRSSRAISAPARSTARISSRTSSTSTPPTRISNKYYTLFAKIDTEPERFLEFERWWGGFFLMDRQEISWIVENLFVGNNLAHGEARMVRGTRLRPAGDPVADHRVRVARATTSRRRSRRSTGSRDIYPTTEALKANGQVIVGLMHKSVGHLGIFVSGAGRQARAHADRRSDRVHRASAARPLRHAGRGAEDERKRALRRDADRAAGRGPSGPAEIRPQGRGAVQDGRGHLGDCSRPPTKPSSIPPSRRW